MASSSAPAALPPRPIDRLTAPFARFLRLEAASGVVLLACTLVALGLANSPLAERYAAFWSQTVTLAFGSFKLSYPLWYWINDGLMALFFFVIGLEIKRELVHGELRDPRSLAMPVAAAVAGAAMPVVVFLFWLGGGEGRSGWAVPMATDIAFVVGCMALLGSRIPHGLKILVLSLAIVDDILAVLVIAFAYSGALQATWLGGALAGFAVVFALNRAGVRTVGAYVVVGVVIWLCTLKSGLHPTVAGVALGLMTPASAWLGHGSLVGAFEKAIAAVRGGAGEGPGKGTHDVVAESVLVAREAVSPLQRLEHAMHPWVAFGIMPVFALANAGVEFSLQEMTSTLSIAIAAGLALGKPIGITVAVWLVARLGLAPLPSGTTWPMIVGAGALAGIGFTMALFVASLGLQGDLLDTAKAGVLLGSAVSLIVGMILLRLATRRGPSAAPSA